EHHAVPVVGPRGQEGQISVLSQIRGAGVGVRHADPLLHAVRPLCQAAEGAPCAGYGPRGAPEGVANIRSAVPPGVPAVLLANHGVLIFHRTPDLAILVGGVVEEAAQASMNAAALGGPVEIPPDLRAAALQRAMTFDSQGTVRAYA